MSECWVQSGCCCRCKYRLRLRDLRELGRGQIGWVCVAFAFMEGEDIAYQGNFEHGLCELFTGRR